MANCKSMKKLIRRTMSNAAYCIKRCCMLPFDIVFAVLGGIPPSYYDHVRHEAELDAWQYEDFKDEWMTKHNASEEDFYNEFEKPCNGPNASLGASIRHDMICRAGIDINELWADVLKEEALEDRVKEQ